MAKTSMRYARDKKAQNLNIYFWTPCTDVNLVSDDVCMEKTTDEPGQTENRVSTMTASDTEFASETTFGYDTLA